MPRPAPAAAVEYVVSGGISPLTGEDILGGASGEVLEAAQAIMRAVGPLWLDLESRGIPPEWLFDAEDVGYAGRPRKLWLLRLAAGRRPWPWLAGLGWAGVDPAARRAYLRALALARRFDREGRKGIDDLRMEFLRQRLLKHA